MSSGAAFADVHERYEADGFVGPLTVLTNDEARQALIRVQTELASSKSNRFKLHLILPEISRIAHHTVLIQAVQQALNSHNVWLWSSDINIKPPNSNHYFAPHQDATYAGLKPSSKCLTAWVALSDPVGEQEGCLSFYPGSHKFQQLPHLNKLCPDNLLSLGQYIADKDLQKLPNTKPVSVPLLGGQATLHSFDNVHMSGPNKSGKSRVGLALRYMTVDVVQTKPVKEMATFISGSTENPNFEAEPRLLSPNPTAGELESGRMAQLEAVKREEANYFADSLLGKDCSETRTSYS